MENNRKSSFLFIFQFNGIIINRIDLLLYFRLSRAVAMNEEQENQEREQCSEQIKRN